MTKRDDRVQTQVRLPPELHEALKQAADQRDVSTNWLVVKALQEFLPRLLPPDEIRWTYEREVPLQIRTVYSGEQAFPDMAERVAGTPLPPVEPG